MSGRDEELEGLVRRYDLDRDQSQGLGTLRDVLAHAPHAPSAVRDPARVLRDHLADALAGLEVDELASAGQLVDIGSGAGVPALPLAIALPDCEVVALESNARKTAFIRHAIERLGLKNAAAVAARAEEWPEGRDRFDVVTARALAPIGVVAEYAAPLLRPGGVLVAWRGRRDEQEDADAAGAAALLGLAIEAVRQVQPYEEARHRHLHVLRKVAPTPGRFPRRPGMARKRPLPF